MGGQNSKSIAAGQVKTSQEPHVSLPGQVYFSTPDVLPRRKPGYKPTNCGEPKKVISNLSTRDAYRCMASYIDEDPGRNCCTFEADNLVKLWKATVLPVELTNTDVSITFFYNELLLELDVP